MPVLDDNIIMDITDCPFTGLKRKAEYKILAHYKELKRIDITVRITHYDVNGVPVVSKSTQPYEMKFIADNDVHVDATGTIIDNWALAPIDTITVDAGGQNYTTAAVKINGVVDPDFTATLLNGAVVSITSVSARTFDLPPVIEIEGDGTGADISSTLGAPVTATSGQYDFIINVLANKISSPFELIAFAIVQAGTRGRFDQ